MYRLGPFLLASEIPLPELDPLAPAADPADVSIRLAPVPQRIANVIANESRWWSSREEYLLHVPEVANFLVRHGREVLVEPAPQARPEDIRAYLLSPIFSTLCHQAGMYSLHASAVRVGDGVVAFLGDSGAGKSTLAASLAQRGYTVLADDICLLDPRSPDAGTPSIPSPLRDGWEPTSQSSRHIANPAADSGPLLVIPVAPALKLWRSALEQLGASPEALPRVFSRDDKYRIKLAPSADLNQRLPLREVLFLEWSNQDSAADPDAQPTFTPVEGVHAIARLMEFTHYDYLMKPTGRQSGNFLLCGRILAQARTFALRRPRNFARLGPVLDALQHHLAAHPLAAK
jgi:Mrp family chromosome partitioning ATPase